MNTRWRSGIGLTFRRENVEILADFKKTPLPP